MRRKTDAFPTLIGADVMLGLAGVLMVLMALLRVLPNDEALAPTASWIASETGLWLSPSEHIPLDALSTALLTTAPVTLIIDPDGREAAFLTESRLAQLGGQEITLIRRSTTCERHLSEGKLSCAP